MRETIARYAKANRIEIVQEFRDKGVSGAVAMEDALDRPGLKMCNGVAMGSHLNC
jgi:hypothetical protein